MKYDIIAIGASMGGFQALKQIINELPDDFKATVLVVLHIPAGQESFLSEIYGRISHVQVHSAVDGDILEVGHVYVAVPDYHLQVKNNCIVLDHGPKLNFHRPAVDALFSSVAKEFGPRAIGVVLTGALEDGTAGLVEIKRHGGICVVQDPSDAANPSMPASALAAVDVDYCVKLNKMGQLLIDLAGQRVEKSS